MEISQVSSTSDHKNAARSGSEFSVGPVSLVDRDVQFIAGFLTRPEADAYLSELRDDVEWSQHIIRIRGREVASPRLSAWFGDPDAHYSYSGLSLEPSPWLPLLAALKVRVEAACRASFNSVLLNLYRDGADSMGWHSDDEPELGERPVVASLSLGATRRFRMRNRMLKGVDPVAVDLESGSLLMMSGESQREWMHQVPKTRRPVGQRINLTFRKIGESIASPEDWSDGR